MELELRHLRVVCAVAESGSVTKAAARLGLAQPALTTQLQRIERALGGALFERDRRGARPTPLGELVLARAKVLLPAVDNLRSEAVRLTSTHQQTNVYRIGSMGNSLMAGLVMRLSDGEPEAQVTTQASWSAVELVEQVSAGRLDFVLVGRCGDSAPPSDHGLEWRVIAIDAVGVLLPEGSPLASGDEVNLADLADVHWAATPGDGCFGECFAAACARAQFTPKSLYETDLRVCIELVEAGKTVVLCQPTFRETPGIVALPLAGAPLRWRHLLGWHPDAVSDVVADRIYHHAIDAYRDSLRHSPRYASWLRRHPRFGAQVGQPMPDAMA
jgi:DNA-binding transcriptional LysR family regulator